MAIKIGGLIFVANLIIGLYFINAGFNFIVLPELFLSLNKWINIVGGILLIIGGYFAMRAMTPIALRR
ncbi:MAG: hypothetical protein M1416_02500 [Candidatus Pacearchaeota archaeon]|nr:hypothetical protein [Candidatus Pacearchaeota archaeon]